VKTVEIRRHSMRAVSGVHLTQAGVALARRIGQEIGPFDYVVTSVLPRAFETAIAMGFAVDEQVELLSSYSDGVAEEVPWPQSFAAYASALKGEKAAAQYAKELARYYAELANNLTEGRAALVINHGGVVELGVVGCFPNADYASWGEAVSYCEGARLTWEAGKFVNAEILRVST
jgi:broad specificity phosphatase PhoE